MLNLPQTLSSTLDLIQLGWQIKNTFHRLLPVSGLYEVLDYESLLELHDTRGTKTTFTKEQTIHYLQNNIIAIQDTAWGDGDILPITNAPPAFRWISIKKAIPSAS